MQNLVRGETRVLRETNKTSSQLAGCPDDINGGIPRDRQPCYVASRQKFRRCATPPTSVPYRSLPVVLLLPGDRPRPLNGILGDDCSPVASPATDMLNNKNLSDLCCPELDTDGTRRQRRAPRCSRWMKLKSSREIWPYRRISVDRRMAWEWARGWKRVSGTWKTTVRGLIDWKVFVRRTDVFFFKSFAALSHPRSLGCIVREIGANTFASLFPVKNIATSWIQ